ncbi:Mss4-like protein [Aspergillus crustosus]
MTAPAPAPAPTTETTTTNGKPLIVGTCACRKTRYHTTSPPTGLTFCYCRTCRLLHGAPFAPFTNVPSAHFHWIDKEELIEVHTSPVATRTLCGGCYAPITMVYRDRPEVVGVVASTVDEGESEGGVPREVEEHMFVEGKPAWFVIGDQGKQVVGVPEGLKGLIPEGL